MYEENSVFLRELNPGDKFTTKGGMELVYICSLENDRHRIGEDEIKTWEVPNGNFPVFKFI